MTRRHAEIAGAGFAGLAAATALCQRGWTVRVHEASPELREAGAGIFLWDNAMATLRALGADDRVMAAAHQAASSDVIVNGHLKSRQPTNTPDTYRMVTTTRQHLYSVMLDIARGCGADIVAGSRVSSATPSGRITLSDGQELDADLVIAADGVQSTLRDSLRIETHRRRFSDGIIRTLVRTPAPLTGDALRVVDHWVTEPVPRRILYVPCGNEIVYLAMMAGTDDARGSKVPVDRMLWRSLFPALDELLGRMSSEWRHDVYRSTRVEHWSSGRVAFLGDAAHAMPPTLGQGAGLAIGNALALAEALQGDVPIERALARWEESTRPLTETTQMRAEKLAELGPQRIEIPKSELGKLATHNAMERG